MSPLPKRLLLSTLLLAAMSSTASAQSTEEAAVRKDLPPGTMKTVDLAEELLAMEAQDQLAREELSRAFQASPAPTSATMSALGTRIQNVDVANLARLKQIVAAHGWPDKAEVGGKAAHAVFILVQHADSDVALQKQYLAWLEQAWRSGAVVPAAGQAVAMLTDRIRGNEHKPQLYGTQVLIREGKAVVKPIEDARHVDKRRAALGMPPLAEYLAEVAKAYGATPGTEPSTTK